MWQEARKVATGGDRSTENSQQHGDRLQMIVGDDAGSSLMRVECIEYWWNERGERTQVQKGSVRHLIAYTCKLFDIILTAA